MTSLDSQIIFVCNVMHRSIIYIQNSSFPKTNHSGIKPSLLKRNDKTINHITLLVLNRFHNPHNLPFPVIYRNPFTIISDNFNHSKMISVQRKNTHFVRYYAVSEFLNDRETSR